MSPGTLAILNVGTGDTKLSFNKKDKRETARAAKIVEDMLRRGYALLIQVGTRKGEPIFQRAKAFDPKRNEYIIAGGPDEAIDIGISGAKAKRPGRRPKAVPAKRARGVAVARTAGGCPPVARGDSFERVRGRVSGFAAKVGEWAGIPMPVDGEHLVIEPSYPFAKALTSPDEPVEDADVRNIFYVRRHRRRVVVWGERDGRVTKSWFPGVGSLDMEFRTMACSVAWGEEQERRAMATLRSLVQPHKYKSYKLTGQFIETSPRSGLTYMFRRLRPTVALDARSETIKVRCTLCMHPIGYYDGSWAGAMAPTDDVIAHLMLMRGDEPMFWRRCNQHLAEHPESGL